VTWPEFRADEVVALAPDALGAFTRVLAAAPAAADPVLVELARRRLTDLLSGTTQGPDDLGSDSPAARVCIEVAEQFTLDVGSTTDALRAAFNEALGSDGFAFVQVLYALDMGLRVPAALHQLYGIDVDQIEVDQPAAGATLWDCLQDLMAAIARLDALDPVTSELIRLRGARAHNCRVCKSRRSVRAIGAGADETTFDEIDLYETSTLSERHKVALRLTDAIIWQPLSFPPSLGAQVRDHFTPAEALEVVLDVARNAMNKIAVALGADRAQVRSGVEYFDTDARGEVVVVPASIAEGRPR
jgi:alkylhydroperoxidase family enzyme